ncbi:acyl-CoA dehydrogenase [Capsaspora owczarzaki ATCC 30864]|uniref:Acyl-CoA dehydrogenase n=1 Tax=Capsaspora owczarzaki (strain ATCC 30864) TaxID=595528 RepID=A0A0D2WVL9_CAPO3|nr:acyl-CoA dehydrogenase [Capsaspora owczarzaki ATCC 30864]KJE96905.1 acyl-CoA dehydrogenase [Capsaspora owczarzaki ATCC 30864]|eukprot:XP_004343878.2 acyl-CoA dehydrogenase [Capsaspora owczarzaki ATCC 30864]
MLSRVALTCARRLTQSTAASIQQQHQQPRALLSMGASAARAAAGAGSSKQQAYVSPFDERPQLTDEHRIFRDAARRFFETEVAPHHAKWEQDGMVSREVWEKAGAAGLLGTTIPVEYGGGGGDAFHAAIAVEEQLRLQLSGPGFSLHSDIIIPYILHYGSEEQKQKWIPLMCQGKAISAIGMSEPSAGSDLQGIKTTAVRDGDDYVINGSKIFISNGQMADIIVLVAKTDPSKGAHGTSLILVETDRPGFQRGRNLKKLGLKAQDTSELFFDNVRVPASNLLGKENHGFKYLMQELGTERLVIGVLSQASAEGVFADTVKYVNERQAFGKSIASFQNTKFKLAEMKTQLSVGRVFIDRCLELQNQGKLDPVAAAIAKLHAGDMLAKITDECLQLHGGYGFMWEYTAARAYADARVQRIYGGTSEIMKDIISRTL